MPHRRWLFVGLAGALLLASFTPSVWYLAFPPQMTTPQRRILEQAEVGLTMYATRSPCAKSFYLDARRLTRHAVFLPRVGTYPVGQRAQAPITVAVHPESVLTTIATYDHQRDLVLFIEPRCDSLSHVALGLIYAHELRHRRDFRARVYRHEDHPRSDRWLTTELWARVTVLRILSEYTGARWDSAVVEHNRIYRRQTAAWRQHRPLGKARFHADERWLNQEFGHLTPDDVNYLIGYLQFDSALRLALPDSTVSPADSLRYNLATLRAVSPAK